jgi:hypothetical protein
LLTLRADAIRFPVVFLCRSDESVPAGCVSSIVSPLIEIHVPLQGLVDVGGEIVKMEKNEAAVLAKLKKLQDQMASDSYAKVPAATKAKNDEQLANDTLEAQKIKTSIDNFKSVLTPEQHAQYKKDKLTVAQTDRAKIVKKIDEFKASLPEDVSKHPKKTLQKIAETESELNEIDALIASLAL